jgi:hypothetical protein
VTDSVRTDKKKVRALRCTCERIAQSCIVICSRYNYGCALEMYAKVRRASGASCGVLTWITRLHASIAKKACTLVRAKVFCTPATCGARILRCYDPPLRQRFNVCQRE